MDNLDFNTDIEIDPSALDVELLRQATLFYKYSKHEAKMKKELAEAQEQVKTIRSELIRETADDKTIKNAQQTEAYYRNDPDYQEAKRKAVEAEYEANMAAAAVWAFNQRKVNLENLVKLALADYFARPNDPRDLQKEYNKKNKREEDTKSSRIRARRKLKK